MVLRIGVLGAARINVAALLGPATRTDGVDVTAIAARDPDRAAKYARRHRIPRVLDSYERVIDDPLIDAVYIPLPAALHGAWTRRAIAAGKHVLVEKPFTANGDEAAEVAKSAVGSGLVVMEAHHTSFHPFTARLRALVKSGLLGEVRSASGWFHAPIPPGRDIRWNAGLGGGAMMDVGCYPLRMIRDLIGEPTVITASALQRDSVDRRMTATYDVAGINATVDCGIWSSAGVGGGFSVVGSKGRLRVRSPYHPQLLGKVLVEGPEVHLRESADRKSSYRYQLEAFRDAVHAGGAGNLEQAVATMRSIDETYRAAGMRPRVPQSSRG
ncbi:Gfo/Idh/MocA family oxidoreductase [Microbacterium sp. ARD31]|uniref:Gfo/Idh/MocA family protein n=1 Tax=Microbacterium sp. ARD31 TaxID=2962576 RepID=UPI002881E606|nr:Gfo/Idh/MocA family oxidoreductase [Microbacterium sp. ARD31]MDT0184016.1 Gfo/Idh/MocA family oxidoreductase [Microbacterium sp. ARD31]